jgi:hypothetical protein
VVCSYLLFDLFCPAALAGAAAGYPVTETP